MIHAIFYLPIMVDTLVRNEPQNVRMSIITVDLYFDNKGVIAGFLA